MAELKKGKIVTMKRIIHRERSDFLELERDSARKVIFLDIDGVLNQDNGGAKIEEQFVRRLAHIVEETGAEIVLSSSWRGAYVSHVDPEYNYQNEDVAFLISKRYTELYSGASVDSSMTAQIWIEGFQAGYIGGCIGAFLDVDQNQQMDLEGQAKIILREFRNA